MSLLNVEFFIDFFFPVLWLAFQCLWLPLSEENSAINHIVFPLYVFCHFSLLFSRFLLYFTIVCINSRVYLSRYSLEVYWTYCVHKLIFFSPIREFLTIHVKIFFFLLPYFIFFRGSNYLSVDMLDTAL